MFLSTINLSVRIFEIDTSVKFNVFMAWLCATAVATIDIIASLVIPIAVAKLTGFPLPAYVPAFIDDLNLYTISIFLFVFSTFRYISMKYLFTVSIKFLQNVKVSVISRLADTFFLSAPSDNEKSSFDHNRACFGEYALALYSGFLFPLLSIYVEFIVIILILILLFFVNPALVLLCASLASVFLLIGKRLRDTVLLSGRLRARAEAERVKLLEEFTRGAVEFKFHDRNSFERKRYHGILDDMSKNEVSLGVAQFQIRPLLELTLFTLGVAYFLFTQSVQLDVLSLSLVMYAAFRILPSISKISNSLNSLYFGFSPAQQVVEKAHTAPRMLEYNVAKLKEISDLQITYERSHADPSGIAREVILKRGDICQISGRNGVGKSVFLKTLLGINTVEMFFLNILVNGVPIKSLFEAREVVGYVPQVPYIFEGSILENLFVNRDDFDAVRRAKEILVELNLPSHETEASTLSGGQRQRVVLAREILKGCQILVLDEATASSDVQAEQEVFDYIVRNREEYIVFFVHHGHGVNIVNSKVISLDVDNERAS